MEMACFHCTYYFFFNLRSLHVRHTPAAEAASTEGKQQDQQKTSSKAPLPAKKVTQLRAGI